jgi:plasmid stabilization system protein ParE
MQVKWLARALANLTDEADYIEKESPANAKAFFTHILTSVGQLKEHPHLGSRKGHRYARTGDHPLPLHCSLSTQEWQHRNFAGISHSESLAQASLIVGSGILGPVRFRPGPPSKQSPR